MLVQFKFYIKIFSANFGSLVTHVTILVDYYVFVFANLQKSTLAKKPGEYVDALVALIQVV